MTKRKSIIIMTFVSILMFAGVIIGAGGKLLTPKNSPEKVIEGVENTVEINIGTLHEGKQVVLSKIKVPEEYMVSALYMDKEKHSELIPEATGKTAKDAIDILNNPEKVPNTIVVTDSKNNKNSITYTVVQSKVVSIASEKRYVKNGEVINDKSYAYKVDNSQKITLVHELNKDWTIIVQHNGILKNDTATVKEVGASLLKMVVSINKDK